MTTSHQPIDACFANMNEMLILQMHYPTLEEINSLPITPEGFEEHFTNNEYLTAIFRVKPIKHVQNIAA